MKNKIKQLSQSGKYRELDNNASWSDFKQMWKWDFVKQRIYNDLVKLELRPLYNSLSATEKRSLYKSFKEDSARDVFSTEAFEQRLARKAFVNNLMKKSNFFSSVGEEIGRRMLVAMVNNSFRDFLENKWAWAWRNTFRFLMEKYNLPPIRIPVINRSPGNSILSYNMQKLGSYIKSREDMALVRSVKLFSEIRIGSLLGQGAYGKVYDLPDINKVLKVFRDGVHLNKDLKRMGEVVEAVYGGTASLEDMHYFDYGKIKEGTGGEDGLYYAIMPKIIPLESSDVISGRGDSLQQLLDRIDDGANPDHLGYYRRIFGDEVVDRVVDAYKRAKSRFGGTDLHAGNLGFLPQKPDTYVFYDM